MSLHLHPPIPAMLEPPLMLIPLMGVSVSAGFPSPAEDWAEERVDLNLRYVQHAEATFYFTVSGDSMVSPIAEHSIPDGATLIVDRALSAKHGDIVVAVIDSDFTVKRLYCRVRAQPYHSNFLTNSGMLRFLSLERQHGRSSIRSELESGTHLASQRLDSG